MDRRSKATLHRNQAARLNVEWRVGAVQARYSDNGRWYSRLSKFPAALFDAHGYVVFQIEDEYLRSPHISIGKQIGIRRPGISGIPGYVRMRENDALGGDPDIHPFTAIEGRQLLVEHLRRERDRAIVRKKKAAAESLGCEVCGFSFDSVYGEQAAQYCEVHHLQPLGGVDQPTRTRLGDLAILCSNCHRVIHLRNPPYTLDEVREMLRRTSNRFA